MAASWHGVAGKHWQGGRAGPPHHAQLVDRASSPLTLPADGSVPAGETTQQDAAPVALMGAQLGVISDQCYWNRVGVVLGACCADSST
jgi:hypothetical protein